MPSTANIVEDALPNATINNLQLNEKALEMTKVKDGQLNHIPTNRPYTSSLETVPVTFERQLYIPQPGHALIDPGVARANVAASSECPDGTAGWREKHAQKTVLQQHCTYWDPDQDGIIYPWDIYNGCAAWGWNPLLCLLAACIIAGALSYATLPAGKYVPDVFFRIYLDNIHKDKHGSDSNTFDMEGRFRPQQFEDFFAKYDKGDKGGLSMHDLARAWRGQRMAGDPFGWTAGLLEWLALYLLVWPVDGIIKKDDIRASYDGSLFQRKADEYAAMRKAITSV